MKKTEEKVIKFIKEKGLIAQGDKVLVALSGGPDSVFLLYFLTKFSKKYRIEVGAVHVNHMIRGKSAEEDEEFCRKLSVNLNIKFLSFRENVKNTAKKGKISLEEAGRIVRYKQFEKALKLTGFNKVATAHNCSDNAETVLLNLIKGTGIKGISGIPAKRGNFVRPILSIKKDEILQYLNNAGIKFRVDESNLSSDYERNYLRNDIIPLIKKRLNPDFENAVFNSAENFAGVSGWIERKVKEKLNDSVNISGDVVSIIVDKVADIDEELKTLIIKYSVEEFYKIQLTHSDIKNINSLFLNATGKTVDLSNNLIAERERNFVTVKNKIAGEEFRPVKITEGIKIKVDKKNLSIKHLEKGPAKYSGTRQREYISADKISGDFYLRRWKAGDKFCPLGLKGTKKISDFLNEQKITSSKKKEQLILTNKGKIVWVLGLRIDDRFKITNNTKRVIELCLK